jgi:hypothetical protein
VSVYLLPGLLLIASSSPGLKVCVCPVCCPPSCYLPVHHQVTQSVSVYLLAAFLLPASTIPGLTFCVRLPATCLPATCQHNSSSHSLCPSTCCLPATCQFNTRSHSQCPSTCYLPSCYLPVQIQLSQSVSV